MKILILSLFLFLGACAPTSYVYVKPIRNDENNSINQVVIMVEYLEIKQDSDDYWDFDEDINLLKQDELYIIAKNMLKSKGYNIADKSLKTSGLIVDRNFMVDHYVDKKQQDQVISPPYIVRSINIEDENIQGLEMLLAELNRPISPALVDLRSFVFNNYKPQMAALNIDDDSAIFIIQVYKPRVSVFSNLDIGFGVSSSGSSVGISSHHQKPISYAYLIRTGTGNLIWSNKTQLITNKNQEKFFNQLPLM